MPASAIPVLSVKVEWEMVPQSGTYVDVSARAFGVTINRPRTKPGADAEPGTVTFGLYNNPATAAELTAWGAPAGAVGFSPFTPDSPVAAFFPNIEQDRRIKITYTWNGGANTSLRGIWWVQAIDPDAGPRPPSTAVVMVTGADIFSQFARRKTLSQYGELCWRRSSFVDYWPFNDDPNSQVLKVSSAVATSKPAQVVLPNARTGSATLSTPDGGHLTDGQIELTRGDAGAPGPVILCTMRPGAGPVGSVAIWVRLTNDPLGANDDVMTAYDGGGTRLWRLTAGIVGGLVQWTIYDDANTIHTFNTPSYARDDAWRWIYIQFTATTTAMFIRNRGSEVSSYGNVGTWPTDPSLIAYITVGGNMAPGRKGKQTNTLQGVVSSFQVSYGFATGDSGDYTVTDFARLATTYRTALANMGVTLENLVGGGLSSSPTDNTPVIFTVRPTNLLDYWNELARTTGAFLGVTPTGQRIYRPASDARSSTVVLTLDAELDLSAPDGGWTGAKDEVPTRVTASGPVGTLTSVNAVAEAATGVTVEGPSLDTAAGTDEVLASVGNRILTMSGTRLSSFGVDLTTTSTDKLTAILGLSPGHRMRVTGLPSAYAGVTFKDVYANGWREEADPQDGSVAFIFDTDPADDPPEGVFDDGEYGRFAIDAGTITSGTCVGTTGTGTVVITSNDPLTTSGAEYPLDLNWNGERITISGVGGATSPQTATVTARGVAPSVARVHTAGETVDVYHALTWSF